MRVNQRLDIVLPAPTDYIWDFTPDMREPADVTNVAAKPDYQTTNGTRTETFYLTTVAPGTVHFTMVYRPMGDFNGTPIDRFEFVLNVRR